jgi:phage tail tape-measure protein
MGFGAVTGDELCTAIGVLLGKALGSPLGFIVDSDEGYCEASTLGDLLGCSVLGCGTGGFLGAVDGKEPALGIGAATGGVLGNAIGVPLDEAFDSLLGLLDGSDEGNCEASALGDLLGCSVVGC